MKDPFLQFIRSKPRGINNAVVSPSAKVGGVHSTRAHSKFSASGAERWFNCPGSVQLSEGLPDKPNIYAEEGTRAHEVLEAIIRLKAPPLEGLTTEKAKEMFRHCINTAEFIRSLCKKNPDAELLIEEKVFLGFLHEEAFGTLDYSLLDYFSTLHVLDFKYGMTFVSPVKNLQFIFYAIAVAYAHHWNFKRVRMWTLQPRIKGFDGFPYWEISIEELREYVDDFRGAIQDVIHQPDLFVEGSWCHWCKAKSICPLKQEKKFDKAKQIFQVR